MPNGEVLTEYPPIEPLPGDSKDVAAKSEYLEIVSNPKSSAFSASFLNPFVNHVLFDSIYSSLSHDL